MKYIYKGTLNTIEILEKSDKDKNKDKYIAKDVVLVNGKTYELPEKNEKITALVRKGNLIAIENDTKEIQKSKKGA